MGAATAGAHYNIFGARMLRAPWPLQQINILPMTARRSVRPDQPDGASTGWHLHRLAPAPDGTAPDGTAPDGTAPDGACAGRHLPCTPARLPESSGRHERPCHPPAMPCTPQRAATTASPISEQPSTFSPGRAMSAVRAPAARTFRTACSTRTAAASWSSE